MKKAFLLLLLLQLAIFSAKADNCGSFRPTTVCSQSPPGQQANCCKCIGSQPQNRSSCAGTPVNKGLMVLIVAGLAMGVFALKKQPIFDHEISRYN